MLSKDTVLEIGIGTGFTANYLRSKNIDVTTLDIDAEKKPDIIANIVDFDFSVEYDHFLAFQVFEHIPFYQFERILTDLARVTRKYLFISVPCNEKILIHGHLKFPKLPEWVFKLAVPKRNIDAAHHFWEVGHPPITMNSLRDIFIKANFDLEYQEKAFSRLFFVLKPY